MLPKLTNIEHRKYYEPHLPLMRRAMIKSFGLTNEQVEQEGITNWMLDAAVQIMDNVDVLDGEDTKAVNARQADNRVYFAELENLTNHLRECYPQWREDDKWSLIFKVLNRYSAYEDELIQIDVVQETSASIGTEVVSEADKTEEIPIVSTDTESVPSTVISEEVPDIPDRPEEPEPEPYVEPVEEATLAESVAEPEPEVTPTVVEETPIVEVKEEEVPQVVVSAVIPESMRIQESSDKPKSGLIIEESKGVKKTESVSKHLQVQSEPSTDKGESPLKNTEAHKVDISEEHRIDATDTISVSGNVSDQSNKLHTNKINLEEVKMATNYNITQGAGSALRGGNAGTKNASQPQTEADKKNLEAITSFFATQYGENAKSYATNNFITGVIVSQTPIAERQMAPLTWQSEVDSTNSKVYVEGYIRKQGESKSISDVIKDRIDTLVKVTGFKPFVATAAEVGEGGAVVDTRSNTEKFPYCVSNKDADSAARIYEYLTALASAEKLDVDKVMCKARKASAPIKGVIITNRTANTEDKFTMEQMKQKLFGMQGIYTEDSIGKEDETEKIVLKARKVTKREKANNNKASARPGAASSQKPAEVKWVPTLTWSNQSYLFEKGKSTTEIVPIFPTVNMDGNPTASRVLIETKTANGARAELHEAAFRYYVVDEFGQKKKEATKTNENRTSGSLGNDSAEKVKYQTKTWSWNAYVPTTATQTEAAEALVEFVKAAGLKAQRGSNKNTVNLSSEIDTNNALAQTAFEIEKGEIKLADIDPAYQATVSSFMESFKNWKNANNVVADEKKADAPEAPKGPAPAPTAPPVPPMDGKKDEK